MKRTPDHTLMRALSRALRHWLARLCFGLLAAGPLSAQAEDCPAWDAAVAYTAGQCATHQNIAYRAKWWNQGTAPDPADVWGAWEAANPPAPDPDPEACPAWSASAVYTAGQCATFNGIKHRARWWVQGTAPDAADPWGAWEVASPPTPDPDPCPAWSTTAIYTAGQCVTHAGRRYTARWWTQGETPVVSEWGAWAVQDTPVDPPDPPPVPTTPAGVYFIDADHLGTPRVIADETGKIVWRWDFGEPFGDSPPDDDPDGDGVRFDFPLRFPGQYHDRETGLNYNYFRDYDPGTGRYTTSDPIGLAGGINTYAYVGGNPVSFTDPLGLWRNPSDIYDDAMQDARRSGLPRPHNGLQDAYRHCLASCEMARENTAPVAQCLGWANEKKGDWTHNQQAGERQMDDFNNAVGVNFGRSAQSTQACRAACMGAVTSGALRTYQSGTTPGYWY